MSDELDMLQSCRRPIFTNQIYMRRDDPKHNTPKRRTGLAPNSRPNRAAVEASSTSQISVPFAIVVRKPPTV